MTEIPIDVEDAKHEGLEGKLPQRQPAQPKLFEARDFKPYVGAVRVLRDKMPQRNDWKANCYAALHIGYHVGVCLGVPALLISYFAGQ